MDGCGAFVVLVGRDGVRRWIGAETQAALNRYFGPHDDAKRLPIFPILLDDTGPETLPAFLRLFQMTPWNGADPLPERLLDEIRERTIVANEAIAFEGCPFVGLAAYRIDQAHLFFGRQKETLDALACFFDIRPGSPRGALARNQRQLRLRQVVADAGRPAAAGRQRMAVAAARSLRATGRGSGR